MAFTLIGGKHWTGGYNYLLNLFRVLAQHQGDQLTPVLYVAESCPAADIAPFAAVAGVEVVRTAHLEAGRRPLALVQALVLGRDGPMRDLFRAQRIDVVFEVAQFFGWRLGLPAIAWVTDLQHRALPHMFPGAPGGSANSACGRRFSPGAR